MLNLDCNRFEPSGDELLHPFSSLLCQLPRMALHVVEELGEVVPWRVWFQSVTIAVYSGLGIKDQG